MSALSLTTPLSQQDGSATRYTYPEIDSRLPPQIQWKLDYLGPAVSIFVLADTYDFLFVAPEYALDSMMTPANDLYSLGCVLYAIHMGGRPPFQNHSSIQSLRDNAEGSLVRRDWASGSKWSRCSSELRGESTRWSEYRLIGSRSIAATAHPTSNRSPQPCFTPIPYLLLLARHLDAQLPRSHNVRFQT